MKMNKEMTPLEALDKIEERLTGNFNEQDFYDEIGLIREALVRELSYKRTCLRYNIKSNKTLNEELQILSTLRDRTTYYCARTRRKAQKVIEALSHFKEVKVCNLEDMSRIEALDIIDRKNVDINVLKNVIKLDDNVEVYNDFMKKRYGVFIEDYEKQYLLTKDEFDILKLNIKHYED